MPDVASSATTSGEAPAWVESLDASAATAAATQQQHQQDQQQQQQQEQQLADGALVPSHDPPAGLQSSVAPEQMPVHSQAAADFLPQIPGLPPCPAPAVDRTLDLAVPIVPSSAAQMQTPSSPGADTAADQASAPEADSPAVSVGNLPLLMLVAAVGGMLAYRLWWSRQS